MPRTPHDPLRAGWAAVSRRPARALLFVSVTLVLSALLALLYRAPGQFVLSAWRSDPYYSHGALVFALAVALATWRLWPRRGATPARVAPGFGAAMLAPALAYGLGLHLHSPYLMVWSLWLLAAATALATGGAARLRVVAMPLLLFALTLPTPWTLDLGLIMQDLATHATTTTLGLMGVPFSADLYTFSASGVAFEVTAACSGFQSAVSLLALSAVVAALFPMPPARRRLVLFAAVPLALALNIARILAVVAVALRQGPEAAEGFFHGGSSLLLFLVELVALLALAGLFGTRRTGGATAG